MFRALFRACLAFMLHVFVCFITGHEATEGWMPTGAGGVESRHALVQE